MQVEKQTIGDVILLAFRGEFDAVREAAKLEEIDELIEGALRVIFNFGGLTFVNSSALGYLLKTAKAFRDRGGELVFSEPAKCFRNIVDIYGVDKVFRIFPDDRAALAHFGVTGDRG
jgi:anti-sigma B factor antagonist